MKELKFTRSAEDVVSPIVATAGSAGMDLCAYMEDEESYVLHPHETYKFSTGLSFEIPEGYFGAIFPRSGLSTKHGIVLANCVAVIDSDYRGEVKLPLLNNSDTPFTIENGMRLAQMVIIPYEKCLLKEVALLNSTDRGKGGFGSTGS